MLPNSDRLPTTNGRTRRAGAGRPGAEGAAPAFFGCGFEDEPPDPQALDSIARPDAGSRECRSAVFAWESESVKRYVCGNLGGTLICDNHDSGVWTG
jgi:hypothetical protein